MPDRGGACGGRADLGKGCRLPDPAVEGTAAEPSTAGRVSIKATEFRDGAPTTVPCRAGEEGRAAGTASPAAGADMWGEGIRPAVAPRPVRPSGARGMPWQPARRESCGPAGRPAQELLAGRQVLTMRTAAQTALGERPPRGAKGPSRPACSIRLGRLRCCPRPICLS